jgi:hypothetical protein
MEVQGSQVPLASAKRESGPILLFTREDGYLLGAFVKFAVWLQSYNRVIMGMSVT